MITQPCPISYEEAERKVEKRPAIELFEHLLQQIDASPPIGMKNHDINEIRQCYSGWRDLAKDRETVGRFLARQPRVRKSMLQDLCKSVSLGYKIE